MLDPNPPLMQARAGASFIFFALAAAGAPQAARAHPLQAAPLDRPHVHAFEQFYLPEDDDAFLAQGGLLLLAELNCAACHPSPGAWRDLIGPKPGPDLRHAGSRLDMDSLWRWIRSPQHRKPGTQMPGLFAGNDASDPDTIEALAAYLHSLTAAEPPLLPADDAERGRELYHQTGCVACHEPATDYRPPSLPPGFDPEAPGLPSSPIALADDYNEAALAAFLLDPLASRPASRMPAQHLTPAEAADIAAYLHTGRQPAAFQERKILSLAPRTPDEGRAAFARHRCAACHETGEKHPPPPPAKSLVQLAPAATTGCLSGEIRTGIPRYDLSPAQVRALRLALADVQNQPPPVLDPPARLDHQLARLNCYACHDRDGKGGPEFARATYFTTVPRQRINDDLEHLPPTLDGIAKRLSPNDLHHRLTQPAPPASPAAVRMPRFHPEAVRALLQQLSTPSLR